MAKIDRKHQKIFAADATNNGQFGSAQLGTKVETNDIDTIQSLAAWETGWLDATLTAERLPTLEEMQGIQYVTTSQIAYIFQEGIAEWNTSATYYENSIVKFAGSSEIYVSNTDDNIGNLPSDPANWDFGVDILKAVYTDETTAVDGSVLVNDDSDSNGRKIRSEPIADFVATVGDLLLPVGSIYMNKTNSNNPATYLGFGTWTQLTNAFIAARGGSIGDSGGSYTSSFTISEANLPSSVTCKLQTNFAAWDLGVTPPNGATGVAVGGQVNPQSNVSTSNNVTITELGSNSSVSVSVLPQYEGAYIWQRTA